MIPAGNSKQNIDRFLGFQNEYDRYRPEAPPIIVSLLSNYLGGKPSTVADIGCGTGLSTFLWRDAADAVVGIEPNPDMLGKAIEKLELDSSIQSVSFQQGYSTELPFEAGSVDIITCSQSFHWMEPSGTLQEIARCLRPGGVFAAYDCDWPLVLQADIENRYNRLITSADSLLAELQPEGERAHKWDKEGHLARIQGSGRFTFAREIVFHNTEACDAARYVGLMLSQGGLQTVLKLGSTLLNEGIADFTAAVEAYFNGRTLPVMISYRMRLGIK
ncbi:SAM-dependent methyltransferase [Paenibacillus sp. FSL R7-0273]|uniref:class I SAM-dependent methyltransferase n=1 Tax=Paenibacillus sp. FSL R7-0273 TaxID=1536772 RepID=UPI0004F615BB|nr:class I SAM-dependent methyltransferase [Paenibacillus sp. FSL R7-0273]AIQ49863.1 SAM-dependent methyltransferase [Paenibacillus sp. FSL R7-0273]OMF92447.1 SAM-dependent methyltransferase [Paenibacillus sp. FSL R7-0273]